MRSSKETDTVLAPSQNSEWLETNGLGDYASGTTQGINTRRYHGLLVANVAHLDRHVLLSTVEDWLVVDNESWPLSSRHHPGTVYPDGSRLLKTYTDEPCPAFVYEAAGFRVTRRVCLLRGSHAVLLHYTVESLKKNNADKPVILRLTPLLAFRSHHALTHANMELQVKTYPVNSPAANGFKIQPYNVLPPLYVQVSGHFDFLPSPEWINVVEYPTEQARGFDYQEDLFSPGLLEIHMMPGDSVIVSASTEELRPILDNTFSLETLWDAEMAARAKPVSSGGRQALTPLQERLAARSACFVTTTPSGRSMLMAGYPWFGSWGRDTLISLPGITFLADRLDSGLSVLRTMMRNASDGIIPNTYTCDGQAGGYNSADASLWFAWACQLILDRLVKTKRADEARAFQEECAQAVYSIIDAYRMGRVPFVRVASSGMLEVGTPRTQLTWMDAQVDGVPVTPRWGFPVEIQALWYNTLAFAHNLASSRGDPNPVRTRGLKALKAVFEHYFVKDDGSLYDVWRPAEDGGPDLAVRPNQLLAVSMPRPIAPQECWKSIVQLCGDELLTPFGLRTLSPSDKHFHPVYAGGPRERDSAYHQGTVWPWLLGPYAEALVKTLKADHATMKNRRRAVKSLLDTITPLFTKHWNEAGVGHISEIFSATDPYLPDGCIAQAWSEGEVLRMLIMLRQAAPDCYKEWEESLCHRGRRR